MTRPPAALEARALSAGLGGTPILRGIDACFPRGTFSVIIGPNASGKSTLLRCLARLIRPSAGQILLDGEDMSHLGRRALARRLGLLPQQVEMPEGITAADLVMRGRHPHQSLFRQWSADDESAVVRAMEATGTADLASRRLQELSGGQRQRVSIAMALAQETDVLLLDEPTTFLDLSHQIEVLDLCLDLNRQGKTLIAVLHDVNLACRYATHLIAMKDGGVLAQGAPQAVMDAGLIERMYDMACLVTDDPVTGTPMIVPRGRFHMCKP